MSSTIEKAIDERLDEGEAGRGKAMLAAVIVGAGAAYVTYKALRNN